MSDAVNHPSHYNVGGIEVIDAIDAWGLNFSRGNVVKYVARAGHKSDEIEDLEKAEFYLKHEIERMKNERSPVRRSRVKNEWMNGLAMTPRRSTARKEREHTMRYVWVDGVAVPTDDGYDEIL